MHACSGSKHVASRSRTWLQNMVARHVMPHRFTRTHDLYDEFIRVLREVDELLLLDIYPAGEAAIEGINSQNIKQSLIDSGFTNVELIDDNEAVIKRLDQKINSDTVFVFQGAGDISSLSQAKKNDLL